MRIRPTVVLTIGHATARAIRRRRQQSELENQAMLSALAITGIGEQEKLTYMTTVPLTHDDQPAAEPHA